MAEYTGSRWYKCDLHLHTMCSRCYTDKDNTPKEWAAQAAKRGLQVIAVTDHNDYRGINAVTQEAAAHGILVFPGVEITCDSSKIHMLILFDVRKKAENVRDFLNRCDIDSELAGSTEGTSMSVFEVCEIAKKRGALVIAAHIDEFSSISSMNSANLRKLLSGGYIDAVQTANAPVWRKYKADKDAEAMLRALQEKYGPDATPQEAERWRKCYNCAEEMGIPMLSFSDNPASEKDSRHGLWGIGSSYTWIQMGDEVDLESLRHSLLTADSRIRMVFDSKDEPVTEPDFWIRSIEIRKTELNPHTPVKLEFHPQLNCVIGGRGSGKSSVVRILSGVYRQLSGSALKNVLAGQSAFYAEAGTQERGIFHGDSEIEIRFFLNKTEYRILMTDIRSLESQQCRVFRTDSGTGSEIPVGGEELLESAFWRAQVFVQRQIHEMTATPGAFLAFIDQAVPDIYLEKARKEYVLEQLVNLSGRLKAAERFLESEKRIRAEEKWLDGLSAPDGEKIRKRQDALREIKACREETETMLQKREELLARYEDCVREIRSLRSAFLERLSEEDGNYKAELIPMADTASFREMLSGTLRADEEMIEADIRLLEEALSSPEEGLQKYASLLDAAREEGLSEEQTGGLSAYCTHRIRQLEQPEFERLRLFRPEDEVRMFYRPNGVKRFFPMTTASSGEKATALFSLALFSSCAPLIIDQPEDDMDNRTVFEEILPKLKKAKQKRQLIIVTHNANITANADAEKIISMDSGSRFVRVRMQGSPDSSDIRKEICDVIEGTEEAFLRRARRLLADRI